MLSTEQREAGSPARVVWCIHCYVHFSPSYVCTDVFLHTALDSCLECGQQASALA
jgi:hypothetical protein